MFRTLPRAMESTRKSRVKGSSTTHYHKLIELKLTALQETMRELLVYPSKFLFTSPFKVALHFFIPKKKKIPISWVTLPPSLPSQRCSFSGINYASYSPLRRLCCEREISIKSTPSARWIRLLLPGIYAHSVELSTYKEFIALQQRATGKLKRHWNAIPKLLR